MMRRFSNFDRMVEVGLQGWREAAVHGLTLIRTSPNDGNALCAQDGHRFINMVSCSYLGLNRHPKIIEGAIAGLEREGTMNVSASRARIAPALLDEVENCLSWLFDCKTIITQSCAVASAGVLPILASGHFTNGARPYMIFDKHCHFSMSLMKGVCGDETKIATSPHNSLEFIEEACRTHPCVAYVADGAYSMGGNAPVEDLLRLQERYGLFLYFDDSHSLSVHGDRGQGMVRTVIPTLGDRTIIVASLAKAFGAIGGMVMLGTAHQHELISYLGGPICWSQMVNASGLGAVLASAQIHASDELSILQARLQDNMKTFDRVAPSANAGNGLPIRVIELEGLEDAVAASEQIYRRGFYTSPVFFPIVARGKAGLRVMGRADLEVEEIEALGAALVDVLESIPT